jgi:hypothetical protein
LILSTAKHKEKQTNKPPRNNNKKEKNPEIKEEVAARADLLNLEVLRASCMDHQSVLGTRLSDWEIKDVLYFYLWLY